MKKLVCAVLSLAMMFSLVACGGNTTSTTAATTTTAAETTTAETTAAETTAAVAADAKVCKVGITVAKTHAYCQGIEHLKTLIEEKTNGSVVLDIYYDGQMGNDATVIQNMQMGVMDGVLCSTNTFSMFAPELELFDLPALFKTKEAAYALADSEVGQEMLSSLDGTGVTGMGYYEGGYYYLTNNKEAITTMEQLKGIKVRAQEATIQLKTWEGLGMVPTVMSASELFTSLQQGVINAQANIAANCVNFKVYEVQHYITEFPVMYMTLIIAFSDSFLNSLTESELAAVKEAVAETIQWQRENYQGLVDAEIQTMLDNGNELSQLADGELDKIVDACSGAYDYARETYGDELIDRILDVVNNVQ